MFLGYVHNFRALAIAFIVFGHCIDAFVWEGNATAERMLKIFISNGSTLFVFIAGYLFQHLSIKYNSKKYLETKFKNVIVPYLLISIPAIVVFTAFLDREVVGLGFYDNPVWVQIMLFYMTGQHLAPLWFIPMIILFYLIAPLLVRADSDGKIYYFLPLFIVISCFVERGLPFQSFVHFFSVYLLGMACSKYKDTLNTIFSDYKFITFSGALIVTFASWEYYLNSGTMTWLNYLQKTVMSLFFLGLFYKFNNQLKSKFLNYVAEVSFGVFFLHSYFISGIKLLYNAVFYELPVASVFSYLLFSIATFISCLLLIFLIKKITRKYSKFMIGC